ncbi:MAG TPA: hypothetical protein VN859_02080 [Steroidobacteraceae bacterium]|nr:hypothetical protein [Steroidobacteraceae bacterium]
MSPKISKRDFLMSLGWVAGGTAFAPAFGQSPPAPATPAPRGKALPNRMARTRKLFKAPGFYPNGMAVAPEGVWLAQQFLTDEVAQRVGSSRPAGKESLWLMDWNGKLQRTLSSDAVNTSGLACGGGSLWVMSNMTDPTTGIHQVDLASGKQVAHRQIPASPGASSGGIHGAQWHQGKLWIVNNRMHSIVCVNPAGWSIETQFPIAAPMGLTRYHDITFDQDGTLLQVIANESTGYADSKSALVRYDVGTGEPVETLTFIDGSCDPHGLENHGGMLVSCDAGYHPGWKNFESPSSGYVFSIEIV